MYNTTILFLLLLCTVSCSNLNKKHTKTEVNNQDFEKIYPFALRGELGQVFAILDSIDNKDLNAQETKLKKKYYNRFINRSERYDYKTQDSVIIGLVDRFHSYWKDVMLGRKSVEEADSLFIKSVAQYLYQKKYKAENLPLDSLQEDLYKYCNAFLKENGYFSNAFGKTAHLYDLFLWKQQEILEYPIELVEDSINVTVYLMKDFISTGWSHYTTFGRNYASGWTTKEALFCVAKAYDLESENFHVSYLTHEGQHFSDCKNFPKLKQRDLEYRAKLVELIKSNKTTHEIINKFIRNASEHSHNAHAFANYCIIRDLSEAIFKEKYVIQKTAWLNCHADTIKQNSLKLFEMHTQKLNLLGKETVTEVIK